MGLNYNPASVTQGLVYYLDLTNSRCYSGSGNTLTNLANGAIGITIVSGITYDTDNRKNLNFNGSSGYMTGNDTNLDFSTSDFTIQTTLKLNGLSNGFTGAYGSAVCAGSALTNNSSILQFSGTASSHYGIALWHQPTSSNIGRNYNFQTNTYFEGPSSEIPKIVPEEVQLWRLRAVIKITGKEAQVETAINNLSEPLKTGVRYAWEYGTIVERFSQTVILLQSILQLSESEVDDMFIQANNISI